MSASCHYDWQYIFNIALTHKRELILAYLVAIMATFASVPLPLLLPLLVDEVLLDQPGVVVGMINQLSPEGLHGPVLYIFSVLALTLLLRLVSLLLNVFQTRQFTVIAKDISFKIRSDLLNRLKKVSMSEYEVLGSGAVSSHFVTDLNTLDQFIGTSISKFLIAIFTIIGVALILLWIHWPVALFILFANPIVIYLTMLLGKHVKEFKRRENTAFEIFQQSLVETLEAVHQIRSSNREGHYFSQLIERARLVKEHGAAFAWKSDAIGRFSFVVFLFGFDIFRAVAMVMVIYSDLSIGKMFAIFGYLWFMIGPVQEMLGIQYAYYGARAALERINNLMDLKEEPDYPCVRDPFVGVFTAEIEVNDLHFSYRDGVEVLAGINLHIEAGEKIALVGASGGGKSTLAQILIGLYPAQCGIIRYNRVPVTEIGLSVIREHVAMVLQYPALFNRSIRENITLGRECTDTELWRALEMAQLKQTIAGMAQGLDTVIGRQGVRLSGGQRQRLAISRMIVSDPKVVILDEATSALDAETEQDLYQGLSAFLKDRTTIIIAHRLSAIKQADHTYIFEAGTICGQGRHQELLLNNRLYAQLYGGKSSHV